MKEILLFLILVICTVAKVFLNIFAYGVAIRVINNLAKGKFIRWICEIYKTDNCSYGERRDI